MAKTLITADDLDAIALGGAATQVRVLITA